MSDDLNYELQRVSALLGLAVQKAGGIVVISPREVAEGVPNKAGVRVSPTDDGGVILELVEREL